MGSLGQQIQTEKDPIKQNKLISQQNSLLSYISGLGIGVGSTDNVLLKRLKGGLVEVVESNQIQLSIEFIL